VTRKKLGIAIGACWLVLCAGGTLAVAAETTATEYKEAVEPICRANSAANQRILAGVRAEVKEGKLKAAAAKFRRAAAALQRTHRELMAVPKPAAEETQLRKWLEYVKKEIELLQKAATALQHGKANPARRDVVIMTATANRANSQILPLDLPACLFHPNQYT
jgi:hypothetical protein